MRKIKSYCVIGLLILCLFLGYFTPATAQSKPIVIGVVCQYDREDISSKAFDFYKEQIEKKTNGAVQLEWKGGPEAINAMDAAKAVQTGSIDAAINAMSYYYGLAPVLDAAFLNYFTPKEERQNGIRDLYQKIHKDIGLYLMGRMEYGHSCYIFTKSLYRRPQDLKGINIRSFPATVAIIKALGANPVSMSMTDVYTGLERGLIDGYITFPSSARDMGMLAPTKYFYDVGFYTGSLVMIINLKKWNRIPKDLQDKIKEACVTAEDIAAEFYFNRAIKDKKDVVDAGVKRIEWSEKDAKWLVDLAASAKWADIEKKAPKEAKTFRELIEKGGVTKIRTFFPN